MKKNVLRSELRRRAEARRVYVALGVAAVVMLAAAASKDEICADLVRALLHTASLFAASGYVVNCCRRYDDTVRAEAEDSAR